MPRGPHQSDDGRHACAVGPQLVGRVTLTRVKHDVVKAAPLFAVLDDDTSSTLVQSMTHIRLERGDIVFHEGDPGDRIYIIGEGKVKLGRRNADGRQNLIAILGPGEMFGELSLFDPAPRTATATAVAETQLLGLANEDLNALLDERPAVAMVLLEALAKRLRRTNENLADLAFTDVPGRVAKALLDLSHRFGRPVEDGILVAHDLTQEELAQLVGASRETVNKVLSDFATRGWLRLEAKAVLVLNVARLERRAR